MRQFEKIHISLVTGGILQLKSRRHNARTCLIWLLTLAAVAALSLAAQFLSPTTPLSAQGGQSHSGSSSGADLRRKSGATASRGETGSLDQFAEVSKQSGIHFTLTSGGAEKHYIIEAKGGGGVAWLDYNNDGFPDLFLVNGSTFDNWKRGDSPRSALYKNNGDGTFTDVSSHSGLDHAGWGMGVCVGDYDNDGWDDLYVTYYGGNVLYHNNGDGTFSDVTEKAGVRGHGWGMGCAFGDYDNDGRLDLYVANYLDVDINQLGEPGSAPNCTYRSIATFCGPRGLPGGRDILFHNNGDGTFEDVTVRAGIDPDSYSGLGVVMGDFDRDGRLDIYVANDSTPSSLYHNNGDGTFTDIAVPSGVAYSGEGQEQAGMGVDAADYDNDGWPDLVKGNFSDDTKNLYHNNRDGTFTDLTYPAGLGGVGWLYTTFGAKFLDYDNDGWKDIFIVNGQVFPQIDKYKTGITYAERNLLFHNRGGAAAGPANDIKFDEVGKMSGPGLAIQKVSRGLATADYDNDGDLEMIVTNMNDSPDLLRHKYKNKNHSILVKTVGVKSNRDGIGTEIKIIFGNKTQYDWVRSGSSYLSSSDLRVHFGLGQAAAIERMELHWPSGQTDIVSNPPVDSVITVQEGRGLIESKPFRKAKVK
ncbi:MAG TPA: CRTAC1 family protein [Terriglobia bacterium]|nr:CRTAC1 family protein [Terriglobia bacterium]